MSRTVSITSMGEYRLVKSVAVHVEQEWGGRYFTYWQDTECSGYGWTEAEALDTLKAQAAARYAGLLKLNKSTMSLAQTHWLQAFENVVGLKVPA